MLSRRAALVFTAASLLACHQRALAGAAPDPVPFDEAAFTAAQKAGKPILVEVTAPWCPACKAQAPILTKLRQDPRFLELRTFTIDFDTGKALMQKFGVRLQSTLICFKGAVETGRGTGETQPEWIEALLEKTL
ncbi:MAG: thioredoxin family protein [Beijerinckiaceae bacterium]|nr:thioredoxin family protein [Beijerinckiaceae bacterium]